MAIESKRGCGYRKIGGLYLVSEGRGIVCDRLPIEVLICPCCGGGIKPARGWTWIQPVELFGGDHTSCHCHPYCPACNPSSVEGNRAGLLWVGEKFYTVESFLQESADMGISRRINSIPRGFKVGKTWIFMAHRKCIQKWNEDGPKDVMGMPTETEHVPGIFTAFRPQRIEKLVKQSEYETHQKIDGLLETSLIDPCEMEIYNRLRQDIGRGITLVPVSDDDPDHQ